MLSNLFRSLRQTLVPPDPTAIAKENSREQCHSCNGQAVSQPQQAQQGSLPSRFLPRPNGPKRPQNKMRYFVLRDADYFWSYDPSENYNPYSFLRLLA